MLDVNSVTMATVKDEPSDGACFFLYNVLNVPGCSRVSLVILLRISRWRGTWKWQKQTWQPLHAKRKPLVIDPCNPTRIALPTCKTREQSRVIWGHAWDAHRFRPTMRPGTSILWGLQHLDTHINCQFNFEVRGWWPQSYVDEVRAAESAGARFDGALAPFDFGHAHG